MPDLTHKHLETFVFDPHCAAEPEIAAMARELISARGRLAELEAQANLQAAYEAWLQGQHGIDDAYWTDFLEWREANPGE